MHVYNLQDACYKLVNVLSTLCVLSPNNSIIISIVICIFLARILWLSEDNAAKAMQ